MQNILSKHPLKTKHGFSYYDFGSGNKTLVVFPDIMGTYESWFPLLQKFEKTYRILIPQYQQIGNLHEMIISLHTFLKDQHIDSFSLIGVSLGGLFAQQYVRIYPQNVERLLLMATGTADYIFGIISLGLYSAGLVLPEVFIKYFVNLAALFSFSLPESETVDWKGYVKQQIWKIDSKKNLLAWGKCVLELCWKHTFHVYDLKNWHKPLFLVESDNDFVFNPFTRMHLRNLYPQATYMPLPRANHLLWINKQKKVITILEKFLH